MFLEREGTRRVLTGGVEGESGERYHSYMTYIYYVILCCQVFLDGNIFVIQGGVSRGELQMGELLPGPVTAHPSEVHR